MGAVLAYHAQRWVKVFLQYLGNSDYLAGMVAMSVMGVVRDAAAQVCRSLTAWILRRLWVTVRLEEKDAELVLAWLRERPEVHASTQLALYSQCSVEGQHARVYEYEPEIQVTTRLRCAAKGRRRQFIWITREGSDGRDRRMPGVTISFFGRNKELLEDILEAGREVQRRKREKYLTVVQVYDYGKEHGLNWLHPQEKDRKQPGRSIASVVLPRCPYTGLDQAEALLEDVREFLASELWYTERGIPYRRGYLLHGVPGGGKSSLVMAVASELMLPIYMLQLSSEQMSDDLLNSLLQYGMHDPPTILLLEDVDLLHSAVLHRRGANEEKDSVEPREESEKSSKDEELKDRKRRGGGRLTLSGLLNALDGPTATTGRVLFMTTNARDRLDPALLRSGRIDYEVEFRDAEQEQIERLFLRFYQDFRSGPPHHRARGPPEVRPPLGVDLESGGVAPIAGGTKADIASDVAAAAGAAPGALPAAGAPAGPPATPRGVAAAAAQPQRSKAEIAKLFAAQVAASGTKLTSADIQRHLMKRKTDPERALRELPELLCLRSAAAAREKKALLQDGGTSSPAAVREEAGEEEPREAKAKDTPHGEEVEVDGAPATSDDAGVEEVAKVHTGES